MILSGGVSSRKIIRTKSNIIEMDFSTCSKKSDEIFLDDQIENEKQIQIFYDIGNFLHNNDMLVPKIYEFQENIIKLEDLGDNSIYNLNINSKSFQELYLYYKLSIDWILSIQKLKITNNHDIFKRKLNIETFNLEMKSFIDLFKIVSDDDKNLFIKEYNNIIEKLCESKYILIHRDFHAGNLMYYENKIYAIDFQDSCLGPATYDLASLLFDTNIYIPTLERNQLIEYYWNNCQQNIYNYDRKYFEYLLHLMGLFRLNKSLMWRMTKCNNDPKNMDIKMAKDFLRNVKYMIELSKILDSEKIIFDIFNKYIYKYLNENEWSNIKN